ncbi:MAG: electron transfer flavoprotein subunit alpha/FixB family protein [Deltaproteobacteria bacterium]|nr:electron transfer flavoprotein subunit alpha/FixB family protein [Deltaproteobacteria bacterium]
MSEYSGVLTYGEVRAGELSPVSLELLGIGRTLADARGEELSMLLIDREAGSCSRDAVAYGADRVYVIEDAPADHFEGACFATIMEKLCTDTIKPAVVVLGQTMAGRDLAPRIAFRLGAGLVTDCVGLELDPQTRNLVATKPVSGGNVLATYTVKQGGPQIASIRRRAMETPERDDGRQGEIVNLPAGVDASAVRTTLVERVLQEQSEGPSLESAEIVVSGGRGIESAEDFQSYITDGLADALGAAVGGTRGAVDAGLISEQQQVGLTGKIVGPDLYFAVGLSGAIQHMAGCSGSKNIVAINTDENAQIFRFAKFGIVGDYKQVLPALIEKLEELR